MLKKALLYLLLATLALVLTAGVAAYLIVKVALAPGHDEWPARVKAGPLAVDIGVPTAIPVRVSRSPPATLTARAMPKSATSALPFERRMFSALMSR